MLDGYRPGSVGRVCFAGDREGLIGARKMVC